MKRHFKLFPLILILFFFAAVHLYAKDVRQTDFRKHLQDIYRLYSESASDSCRQLEEAIGTPQAAEISDEEAKKAYSFLANCNYQLKNLDKANHYYDKAAQLNLNDPQPLIDQGTVYIEQGLYKEAEQKYREALKRVAGDKPQEEKIEEMINQIPGKLQKNFTFSTGFGYDGNVNSGPEDSIHLLYEVFNYALTSDDKPREDNFIYNSIDANLSKALNPETILLFDFNANNTSYFNETEFSSSIFSMSFGYQKIINDKIITLSPFVNYQTFDNESYQISSGLNLSGSLNITERIQLWPNLGWYSQSLYNDDDRDAHGFSAGSSCSYEIDAKTYLYGSFFYTFNNAENNQYTYNNIFLGSSISREIIENFTSSLGYNLQLFYYDDSDPAFGTSRKDTGHTVYMNFEYFLEDVFKKNDASINLNVSYNKNNSNHSFQDRKRLLTSLDFTLFF